MKSSKFLKGLLFIVILSSSLSGATHFWRATDKNGIEVVLEGELIQSSTEGIYEKLNVCASFYAEASEEMHRSALKKYPLLVLLPPVWPMLFKKGFKSWRQVLQDDFEQEITKILTPKENEEYYLFSVKDLEGEMLGFFLGYKGPTSIACRIHPYNPNEIEVFHFMISSKARGRGLSKILLPTILKLLPDTKRIFFGTSKSNKVVIAGCSAFKGFKISDESCFGVEFECLVDSCVAQIQEATDQLISL
jgi:GNAT superfamily N-acetyltransferase